MPKPDANESNLVCKTCNFPLDVMKKNTERDGTAWPVPQECTRCKSPTCWECLLEIDPEGTLVCGECLKKEENNA